MSNVLVIGASRGIGLELVRQHLAAGDRVLATARDEAALANLRDMGAQVLRVDVAEPASVSGLAWSLDGEQLDLAWYVAGVLDRGSATAPPTQPEFDRVMRTNVLGAMQVIPQVVPLVEAAQGRMVFISSAMGCIGTVSASNAWVYRSSKAALNMAVAAAQHDYPNAILVSMSPGWVRTDMGGAGAPLSAAQSVSDMRAAAQRLSARDKGCFLDHDGSRFASW